MGTEALIKSLSWNGNTGFTVNQTNSPSITHEFYFQSAATKKDWYLGNQLTGTYETERNLSYVLVFNSSHMVPVDQGKAVLNLFHRFIGVVDQYNGVLVDTNGIPPEITTPLNCPTPTAEVEQVVVEKVRIEKQYGSTVALGIVVFGALAAAVLYFLRVKGSKRKVEWHELSGMDDEEMLANGNVIK